MFILLKRFFNLRKEIKKLNSEIEMLKLDLRHSLSISEKYLPVMKASDKLKLLILRKKA